MSPGSRLCCSAWPCGVPGEVAQANGGVVLGASPEAERAFLLGREGGEAAFALLVVPHPAEQILTAQNTGRLELTRRSGRGRSSLQARSWSFGCLQARYLHYRRSSALCATTVSEIATRSGWLRTPEARPAPDGGVSAPPEYGNAVCHLPSLVQCRTETDLRRKPPYASQRKIAVERRRRRVGAVMWGHLWAYITHLASYSRKRSAIRRKRQVKMLVFATFYTRFHLIALISAPFRSPKSLSVLRGSIATTVAVESDARACRQSRVRILDSYTS